MADLYPIIGAVRFTFMCATIVLCVIPFYIWIRSVYVYRSDRPGYIDADWSEYSKKKIKMEDIDDTATIICTSGIICEN